MSRSAWGRALALAVTVGSCKAPEPAGPDALAGPAAQSAATSWVRARSAQGASLLTAPARVVPAAEAEGIVAAPLPARIVRVRVQLGERVSKGERVAEVVMPALLAAAGEASGAEARLEAWLRRKAQLQKLAVEGLARASELVEVDTQLAEARASLDRARATLLAAGSSAKEARRLLDDDGVMALRAPIAGVVTELDARVGETRTDGSTLARISSSGGLRLEARLMHAPPPGASFRFGGVDGTRSVARLQSWSPRADPRDGSFAAWFALDEARGAVAGTPGLLHVEPPRATELVSVPATAVRMEGGRARVVARRGDEGVPLDVEVVATSGAEAVVRPVSTGGLAEGTEVASDASAWGAPAGESP